MKKIIFIALLMIFSFFNNALAKDASVFEIEMRFVGFVYIDQNQNKITMARRYSQKCYVVLSYKIQKDSTFFLDGKKVDASNLTGFLIKGTFRHLMNHLQTGNVMDDVLIELKATTLDKEEYAPTDITSLPSRCLSN